MIRAAVFFNSLLIVSAICLYINGKDQTSIEELSATIIEIKPQIVSPKQNAYHNSFRYLIKTDKGFMAIDTFFSCQSAKCQTYAYGLKEGKKYHFQVKGFSIPFMAQHTPRYITSYY